MLLQRVTFNKNRKKLIFKNDIIAVISKAGNDIKKKIEGRARTNARRL